MKPNQKLYLVSHKGLLPGAQAVQACHAMREFVAHHAVTEREWYEKSNHLCFLTVDNEEQLTSLMKVAIDRKIRWAAFQEPAMGMAYTAVALEASDEVQQLLAGLPLALSEYNAFHDCSWAASQPKNFTQRQMSSTDSGSSLSTVTQASLPLAKEVSKETGQEIFHHQV